MTNIQNAYQAFNALHLKCGEIPSLSCDIFQLIKYYRPNTMGGAPVHTRYVNFLKSITQVERTTLSESPSSMEAVHFGFRFWSLIFILWSRGCQKEDVYLTSRPICHRCLLAKVLKINIDNFYDLRPILHTTYLGVLVRIDVNEKLENWFEHW